MQLLLGYLTEKRQVPNPGKNYDLLCTRSFVLTLPRLARMVLVLAVGCVCADRRFALPALCINSSHSSVPPVSWTAAGSRLHTVRRVLPEEPLPGCRKSGDSERKVRRCPEGAVLIELLVISCLADCRGGNGVPVTLAEAVTVNSALWELVKA